MVLAILLAIATPILGFTVGRMKDINTGAKPPVKAGLLGAGWALLALGAAAFVVWVVVGYWSFAIGTQSIAVGTQSSWINLKAVFNYSLLVLLGGSVTMTVARSLR